MNVVFDTNILVAAARSNTGASYKLLSLIPDSRFKICISPPLYFEYQDVLLRPANRPPGLTGEQIIDATRYLLAQAHLQEIYFYWRPFLSDANDDMLLELAVAAQAKYIVTFNIRDFRGSMKFNVEAIRPQIFLRKIGEIKEGQ